jgi:5-methyltetrahydrofolate--homocysteine methyltransferase
LRKDEFRELCQKKLIYLDGATGSNLIKRGMPAGVCPEKWILEHRDVMIGLQREYVQAGTNILYAPTFTANRVKLAEYGLEENIRQINQDLIRISKEAADGKALVAGDITMTGEQLTPMGSMQFEDLIEIYKEQMSYQLEAGVDLFVVETMMSLQESRAAVIAAKEICDLPVMVTMTFEADGRSLYGTDAKTAAIVLSSLGADAVGANCSTGPDQMCGLIHDMASVCQVPIIAKPNAGLPSLAEDGSTVYDMDADTFSIEMKQIVASGATILGGCCGTAPVYIQKLVNETKNIALPESFFDGKRHLASERQSLSFDLEGNFMIVGERINPTGKKKLQAEIREGSLDMVERFAEEQEACGASVLDINMGMSGIDEKEMMLRVLQKVGETTNLPLCIDSSHVDVIEAALRKYPGRALINSISLEKEKFDNLLPLAKKYGAMFILLPLSDKGLPENLEEKKQIIDTIYQAAIKLGLQKEDIVVDGLVATVGANKQAALETLETIRYCKERGLATICGLSNISFGLPERSFVNTAFLTMAIMNGLTMAIANPSQELLVNSALASDLLLNKTSADIRYIDAMNLRKERMEAETPAGQAASGQMAKAVTLTAMDKVKEAVLKGKKDTITALTKTAVEEGNAPKDILDQILLPAINEVGDLFDKGKYFLPQLIASAEAMKVSIEYLEPLLKEGGSDEEMATIVIATVEGDIHDIGKNLVALMLKNYGFRVIDLGKDVSKEKIIETAKAENAKIIGLSALMTTTMQQMRHVIDYAKEQGVDAKIIIGGAVITQEYADEIGADGYSKDAADAVKLVKRILGIEG